MKYLCVFVALSAMSVNVYADGQTAVRPLDAWAGESVTRATVRSAVVRGLVAEIEAANVIVHVETAQLMPTEIAGFTRFVTAVNGYRYVRVTLARNLSARYRAAILGHELQHVWEIAVSEAADTESVRRLFERLGTRNGRSGESFETRAAVIAERRVALELRSSRLPAPGSR